MGSHNVATKINLKDNLKGELAALVWVVGRATATGGETVSVLDGHGDQIILSRYYYPVIAKARAIGTDAANVHLTVGGTTCGTATAKSTTDGASVDLTITDTQLTAWASAKGGLSCVASAAGVVDVILGLLPLGR